MPGVKQIVRGVVVGLVGLFISGTVAFTGDAVAIPLGTEDPDRSLLKRLAVVTSRHDADLSLVAQDTETLLDGRHVLTVKALDRTSGEVLTVSFLGDPADAETPVVDLATARAEAGARWRAEHGAMTPATAAQVAAMGPDARVDVAVWLAAELDEPSGTSLLADVALRGSAVSPGAMTDDVAAPQGLSAPSPVYSDAAPKTPLPRLSAAEIAAKMAQPPRIPDTQAELAEARIPGMARDEGLRAQVGGIRAAFSARLQAELPQVAARYAQGAPADQRDRRVTDAADGLLLVVLPGMARDEIVALARWPQVDAIYIVPDHAGPSLDIAGPTQNADLVNGVGYSGTGVSVAIIEGAYAAPDNPYLTIAGIYDANHDALAADQMHATGVTGIIGSQHPVYRGLAPGATLFAANGDYRDFNRMLQAMAWGQQQATVLNNSWYWDTINNPTFGPFDRQLDSFMRYNRDFVVVAAGNFGDPVCYTGVFSTTYVVSPAKGYNVISVGNYRDEGSLAWDDDAMSRCSSWGDPGGETPSPTHEKPEVVAVGSTIWSTVVSTTLTGPIGLIGSGTSFASPMVAALAADIIQAEPLLVDRPESVKAIIMATALRNLEGDLTLSDVDGVGGIMPTAALATVERGHWASIEITSSASYPITFTQYVHGGERARFVVNWLANPTETSTAPPPDVDLRVTRQGNKLVASSFSLHNTFEIVDFTAVASEIYTFTISLADAWTYSPSFLGAAWWRGTYRIPPDTGFYDPPPTPLGTHLSVYPDDWPDTMNWRAFGIRPVAGDLDLVLSSASWFEDPAARSVRAVSAYPGTAIDYVAVNGRHGSGAPEHYRVRASYGGGNTYLGWSSGITEVIGAPGTYGPFVMGPAETVKAFDLRFPLNRAQVVRAVPEDSGADLAMELFASAYGVPQSWALGRGDGVAWADRYGVGMLPESILYRYDGSVEDIHGLVVSNDTAVEARFAIVVADAEAVWLPLVGRGSE
ncbi:MAG: S8 family serine peptidase [Anaerolineae bacterium]|nr:S8 family serine peptidase [Anaerolineae bacterium]